MNYLEFEPPSAATLKKYGLTADDWLDIMKAQGNVCPICKKVPTPNLKTGKVRFVIDHFHAKNWKKLPPDERKRYVRGITCWFDNHAFLGRGITVEKSRNVTAYLEEFEARKP